MNRAAVYHRATDSYCYPLDGETLHIRLQTGAGEVAAVEIEIGDPHDWERRQAADGRQVTGWRSAPLPMEAAGGDGIRDHWEIRYRPPYHRTRYFFRIHARDGGVWDYGEKGLFPAPTAQGTAVAHAAAAGVADPGAADPGVAAGGAATGAATGQAGEGDYWNAFVFPYINPVDLYRAPDWVSRTVWYQIFPERFRNGDPRNDPPGTRPWAAGPVTNAEHYGGDLAGIVEKLDHLDALGVNGIYLTPIFAAPTVHKYDTEDYLRIDPAFGTEDDLHRLVEGCHERGMRLMLDAVFNHAGKTFGPWKDVLEKGAASRYAGWFQIHSWPLFPKGRDSGDSRDAGFETFAFTTRMPKLNTADPGLREYLLGVAEHYVREFDIDGWRLDVASEVDHEFWRLFRARVKAAKPEAYIVGEIWHDAMAWLRSDQYDAVMNYPYGTAISDFLLGRRYVPDAAALGERLAAIDFSYPLPVLRNAFNLMDSHDTERLLHRMGGDLGLARLGWLLMFMLPGSPCIYYGTEYGMDGGGDPDNRRCMVWEAALQDPSQHAFIRGLIALRRERSALFAEGARRFIPVEGKPGLVALVLGSGGDRVLALANRDTAPVDGGTVRGIAKGSGLAAPRVLLADPREGALAATAGLLPRGFRVLGSAPGR